METASLKEIAVNDCILEEPKTYDGVQESLTSTYQYTYNNAGAIAGFDPIMKMSKRRTKKRKKMESAGKQWDHRRRDPTYIDGRSKHS